MFRNHGKSSLLAYEHTIPVVATKHFVAREHIKSANIGHMGPNFKEHFLDRVEEDIPAVNLVVRRLSRSLTDDIIRGELARLKENQNIFLAHFFQILKCQADGQSGLLIADKNIAYINYFWVIFAYWDLANRKWDVYANSMPSRISIGWGVGNKVFSQGIKVY